MTSTPASTAGSAGSAGSETIARTRTVAPGTRARGPQRRIVKRLTPYLFLLVPLVLLITFTYYPMVKMFWYSVTNWDGVSPVQKFIGPKNYIEIYTRPELFRVFLVSLYYVAGSFVQMALALYFATILSFSVRFKSLFKGILFFPYLINAVAIAMMFLFFLRPGGALDAILHVAHLGGLTQQWLGDRAVVNFSLAGVSVWRYMGLNFVLFLGAIQSIPAQIYEAAELDGASKWQQFRYLIAPGIRPIIGLSFILAIAGALSVFEIPFIMLNGANGSETFVIQTVRLAFQNQKFGLASASAVVLLLLVLLVTWVQRKLVPDEKVDLT